MAGKRKDDPVPMPSDDWVVYTNAKAFQAALQQNEDEVRHWQSQTEAAIAELESHIDALADTLPDRS